MSKGTFITYSHPDELTEPSNRRRVAQYIGIHYRNRSAPTSRSGTQTRSQQHRRLVPATDQQRNVSSLPHNEHLRSPSIRSIPRDHFGFRENPFAVFPTEYSNTVSAAIDYYIQSYAPTHLVRPELVTIEAGNELVKQHFRYALRHPAMFESILALAYSNLASISWTEQESEQRIVYHYGQAISQIRQALSAGYTGDAVLFAIMSLMGVNYLRNDLSAFQSNLMGLRQIIALRGGLNNLAWPTLLKPGILTLESFWVYLSNQTHLIGHRTLSAVVIDEMTAFEGEIEAVVTALPLGFRILADKRRLSTNLLPVIQREAEFDASLLRTPPTSFVHHDGVRKFAHLKTRDGTEITVASNIQSCEELARLLASPKLTPLDIVCCTGLFINSLCITRSEQLSPIYFTQLQHHAKQLINFGLHDDDPAARDLVTWTIFNVASTMVPSKLTDPLSLRQDDLRLALAVKVAKHFSMNTWEDMQLILRRFICSDTCINAWKNVWDVGIQHAQD